METITTISTGKGKFYITKRDKSKLAAYTKRLEEKPLQLQGFPSVAGSRVELENVHF